MSPPARNTKPGGGRHHADSNADGAGVVNAFLEGAQIVAHGNLPLDRSFI